jgi:hypothetical protein
MQTIWKWVKIVVFAIGLFVIMDYLFDFNNGMVTLSFKHILNDIKSLF